jgi:hypothetical protein
VSKHSALKIIKIKSLISGFTGEKLSGVQFQAMHVYSSDGQRLRSWVIDGMDKVLFYTERDLETLSPLSKLLFLYDVKEVLKSVSAAGVPIQTEAELLQFQTEIERRSVEIESLVRWNGSLAWALGQADSKTLPESPQLWFEKDLFLPVRYLYRAHVSGDGSEGSLFDIRIENYKFARESPYPRLISVYKKGTEKILNEALLELSFDPNVMQLPKKMASLGFTELGQTSSPGLKNLIQDYYAIVR